jgi:thiamine-phosphate pyrophosphorylase
MDDFGVCAIMTNPKIRRERFAEICVEEEVRYLQIREKDLSDRDLLELAGRLAEICRGSATMLMLNDRADLASLLPVDGVHLGQDDLPPWHARGFLKQGQRMGLSTHSVSQAEKALEHKPDWIGFGPVYPTPAKAVPDTAVGTEHVGQVVEMASCPVIAIGGLFPDNLEPVLKAGARSIACVRYLMDTDSPRVRILELKEMLARAGEA